MIYNQIDLSFLHLSLALPIPLPLPANRVRQRGSGDFGGAAGSIGAVKQRRIVLAARHYLAAQRHVPACRFDAVLVEPAVTWLRAAFDAGEGI